MIDSNAITEITQYKYDFKTHTIYALEGDLPEEYGEIMVIKGSEEMGNPIS